MALAFVSTVFPFYTRGYKNRKEPSVSRPTVLLYLEWRSLLQVLFLLFMFFNITAGFQMAVNGGMPRNVINGKKTGRFGYGNTE